MTKQFNPTVFGIVNFLRTLFMGLVIGLCLSGQAMAQAADDSEEPNIPEPEMISLTTRDGVVLKCTYFAKPKEVDGKALDGKKVTPVIMVHKWGGKRSDFNALALKLQSLGRAVILPDLRGHGESTKYKTVDGGLENIKKPDKMRTTEVKQVITRDMESVKKFLIEENNAGNLNIDQLVVIGSETSVPLVMNWIAYDASAPMLTSGKQGQYVRAMILLSPEKSCEGILIKTAMLSEAVKRLVAVQIIYGKTNMKVAKDVERIYRGFGTYRSKNTTKNLYTEALGTSLQGTRMIEVSTLKVPERVNAFISQLVDKEADDYPWEERRNPLSQ